MSRERAGECARDAGRTSERAKRARERRTRRRGDVATASRAARRDARDRGAGGRERTCAHVADAVANPRFRSPSRPPPSSANGVSAAPTRSRVDDDVSVAPRGTRPERCAAAARGAIARAEKSAPPVHGDPCAVSAARHGVAAARAARRAARAAARIPSGTIARGRLARAGCLSVLLAARAQQIFSLFVPLPRATRRDATEETRASLARRGRSEGVTGARSEVDRWTRRSRCAREWETSTTRTTRERSGFSSGVL